MKVIKLHFCPHRAGTRKETTVQAEHITRMTEYDVDGAHNSTKINLKSGETIEVEETRADIINLIFGAIT